MGNLKIHVEAIERAYCEAVRRALDRIEELERRRTEAFKKALAGLNIEEERERIKKIMNEIQNEGRMRRP